MVLARLDMMAGLSYVKPDGAFYVLIDISASKLGSIEFCKLLLDEQYVAAIPGKPFGADDCIRISYATDLGTIEKGLDRLYRFVGARI